MEQNVKVVDKSIKNVKMLKLLKMLAKVEISYIAHTTEFETKM